MGREGALSAPGEGAGLGAGSGAADGARSGFLASAKHEPSTLGRVSGPMHCLCGADGRARKALDNAAGWNALPALELDGALVARARSERAAEEDVR